MLFLCAAIHKNQSGISLPKASHPVHAGTYAQTFVYKALRITMPFFCDKSGFANHNG
jgi:hypothetical protein